MSSSPCTVSLSAEETNRLQRLVKSTKAERRLAFRASIIWHLVHDGLSRAEVAQKLNTTSKTVAKWEQRFLTGRLDGLKDLPRCGAPSRFTVEQRCQVLAVACATPCDYGLEGQTRWTRDTLTEVVRLQGMRRTSVWRTLEQNELKPHRVQMWLHSPDPEFKEKVNEIVSSISILPKMLWSCVSTRRRGCKPPSENMRRSVPYPAGQGDTSTNTFVTEPSRSWPALTSTPAGSWRVVDQPEPLRISSISWSRSPLNTEMPRGSSWYGIT